MFFKKTKSSGLTAEIRVRRCYGCGAILQDQDPKEAGYVPPEKFDSGEETLCERCYKLRHYSHFSKSPAFNLDYVTILTHAKEENALAVYVFNAFGLAGSVLEGIGKYLPSNVLVVINKRDCLPSNYNEKYMIEYVRDKLAKENVHPKDILLTSAGPSSKCDLKPLMDKIDALREGKSVYFIGAYQVGKSSLINALLKDYSNETEKMITTSPYPGTTLDVISIPLDEDSYIFDTPGIYNPSSFISFIEPELVKYVLPRNQVRPETYLAKDGQSFVISNFARIDFTKGAKTNFTFYKSNDLPIMRCKVNKADALIKTSCEDVNLDIRSQKIHGMDDLVKTSFRAIDVKVNTLRLVGLAIIDFSGVDQDIDVYLPKGVKALLEADIEK